MPALVVTAHADSVRVTRSVAVRRSRQVAWTGLKIPQQRMSPDSTPMTSTSPPVPGPTNARPTGQTARRAPAVTRTRCSPNRATSGRASRAPSSPPTEGAAKARPYSHGAKPSRPSIRTASSGEVAITRPLNRAVLKNSGRSAASPRMYRQPSRRSPARMRTASRRSGGGSLPPVARMPRAESRQLTASATTVATGPRSPIAMPPSGGPTIVVVQDVDSNRALATSRSSAGSSVFT